MTRLDWEKANRKERVRPGKSKRAAKRGDRAAQERIRQGVMMAFVAHHQLHCFKCGAGHGPWGKTGLSKRGPWAICGNCVRSPRNTTHRSST